MRRSAAALWAAFALGAWQLASVALLGTSPADAVALSLIGGLVVLIVAAWGAVTSAPWAVWLVIALGAAFAIIPLVAGFTDAAGFIASDLITGVLLILLGVVAAVDTRQRARGERAADRVIPLDTSVQRPAGGEAWDTEDDPLERPIEEPAGPGPGPGDTGDENRRVA